MRSICSQDLLGSIRSFSVYNVDFFQQQISMQQSLYLSIEEHKYRLMGKMQQPVYLWLSPVRASQTSTEQLTRFFHLSLLIWICICSPLSHSLGRWAVWSNCEACLLQFHFKVVGTALLLFAISAINNPANSAVSARYKNFTFWRLNSTLFGTKLSFLRPNYLFGAKIWLLVSALVHSWLDWSSSTLASASDIMQGMSRFFSRNHHWLEMFSDLKISRFEREKIIV